MSKLVRCGWSRGFEGYLLFSFVLEKKERFQNQWSNLPFKKLEKEEQITPKQEHKGRNNNKSRHQLGKSKPQVRRRSMGPLLCAPHITASSLADRGDVPVAAGPGSCRHQSPCCLSTVVFHRRDRFLAHLWEQHSAWLQGDPLPKPRVFSVFGFLSLLWHGFSPPGLPEPQTLLSSRRPGLLSALPLPELWPWDSPATRKRQKKETANWW